MNNEMFKMCKIKFPFSDMKKVKQISNTQLL